MDASGASGPAAMLLDHAHRRVRDLDRAGGFYAGGLGLRMTERVGNRYALLGDDGAGHVLGLEASGPHSPAPHPLATGCCHVGSAVADEAGLAAAYRR